jgi:hypothetical protein
MDVTNRRSRWKTLLIAIGLPLAMAACGAGTVRPTPISGRILRPGDLPDMRLRTPPTLAPVAQAFAGALSEGDAVLFKYPKEALPMLQQNGFKRAVLEDFTGPGTFAGAFAAEFASPDKAAAALAAMYQDALQPCPNDPVCSIQHLFSVSDIPGSKGQNVSPVRKFGRGFNQYRLLFQVGSIVYGVGIGGLPESFDPGTVTQAQAYKAFRAVYARVKSGPSSGLFAPTPMPS